MSNTRKLHDRFWAAMAERYGKRWAENTAPKSVKPGANCSIAIRPMRSPQRSKTCPSCARTPADDAAVRDLAAERHARKEPTLEGSHTRFLALRGGRQCRTSYAIVSYMARKRGADAMTPTHLRFEQIVISNKPTLGAAIRSLLEEMCEMEIRTGQRTDGMLMHCRDRSLELMRRVFASLQEAQQLSLVTST